LLYFALEGVVCLYVEGKSIEVEREQEELLILGRFGFFPTRIGFQVERGPSG